MTNSARTTAIAIGILAIVAIGIGFSFDRLVGWRLLGLVEAGWGVWMVIVRRVPYGIEGRPPAGYITGIPAVFIGLLVVALGALFIASPQLVDEFLARGL